MNIVAIILARGGSKRLPGKNIRELAGKPLIGYTIEAAKNARVLTRTIVSTDDPDIARIAKSFGAEVPFMRPSDLAGDESSSLDALVHATDWLDANGPPVAAVVLLQPTSPLRQARHIDEAVDMFVMTGVDTVTAVSAASAHPYWCWQSHGEEVRPFFSHEYVAMPHAQLPTAWVENGSIYVVKRGVLASGSIYGTRVAGYIMDQSDGIDIDTLADFGDAERLLRGRDAATDTATDGKTRPS